MSIQGPFKIDCDEQFPHGLFAVAVGGQLDFEKSQAKVEDAQARDKESGERVGGPGDRQRPGGPHE